MVRRYKKRSYRRRRSRKSFRRHTVRRRRISQRFRRGRRFIRRPHAVRGPRVEKMNFSFLMDNFAVTGSGLQAGSITIPDVYSQREFQTALNDYMYYKLGRFKITFIPRTQKVKQTFVTNLVEQLAPTSVEQVDKNEASFFVWHRPGDLQFYPFSFGPADSGPPERPETDPLNKFNLAKREYLRNLPGVLEFKNFASARFSHHLYTYGRTLVANRYMDASTQPGPPTTEEVRSVIRPSRVGWRASAEALGRVPVYRNFDAWPFPQGSSGGVTIVNPINSENRQPAQFPMVFPIKWWYYGYPGTPSCRYSLHVSFTCYFKGRTAFGNPQNLAVQKVNTLTPVIPEHISFFEPVALRADLDEGETMGDVPDDS